GTAAECREPFDLVQLTTPNDIGQFVPRPPVKKEPDWLEVLRSAEVPPALDGARAAAVEIVATIRALAGTRRWDRECPAARVLLDFAFEDLAGAFRDEVGRQMRTMDAAALPPLIRLAMGAGKVARGERRYANYQLD